MATKERTFIKVETLPNGYALTVEKMKYLYFTKKDLIAGFITHIGVAIDDYMEREQLHDIVTVLLKVKPSKSNIKKLARQEEISMKKEVAAKDKKKRMRDNSSKKDESHAAYNHTDIVPPASFEVVQKRLMLPLKNATDRKNVINVAARMLQTKFGKPVDASTLTLGDVVRLSEDDLLQADFMPKAIFDLRRLMSTYHLTFGMDVDKYIV